MSKLHLLALALAGVMFTTSLSGGIYADAVVQYDPGTDPKTGTTPNLSNPLSALGQPSRVTPGSFGGPVDPFNPPFLGSQLVSIGAGGSLTLQFSDPILNHAGHAFGLDFLIFGNTGFAITNAVGTPATDGTVFGSGANTRVQVSEDGLTFFTLDPARAPSVDGLFPTDGTGNFQVPVNPALRDAGFGGATLDTLRALYDGSAGGAGYDLAWALNGEGQPANLDRARYVRIAVLSDKAEIDGIVLVPEPPPSLLLLATLVGVMTLWAGRRFFRRPA